MRKTVKLEIRIDPNTKSRVKTEAERRGYDSFSEYLIDLIEKDIQSQNPWEKEVMDIYEKVSGLIQQLEATRDYTESGLTWEEKDLIETMNRIWDQLRAVPQFQEG